MQSGLGACVTGIASWGRYELCSDEDVFAALLLADGMLGMAWLMVAGAWGVVSDRRRIGGGATG